MMGSVTTGDRVDKQKALDEGDTAPLGNAPVPSKPPPPAPQPFVDAVQEKSTEYAELTTRWGPAELVDLGPAASVSATPLGAVFVTRDDQVVLAKRKGTTGFEPITLPPQAFMKFGWGPSVSPAHAYWASRSGRLMRASLKTQEVEAVFDRARPTTRTSVVHATGRDVVAFVAEIDGKSYAYVWASPGSGAAEVLDASADGHQATSVSLVEGVPHPRLIVLEGRTSMSPVHSRVVRVTPRRITLDFSEVVWIGPGSHDLTEIHAVGARQGETVAFLPTQKDFNGFGVAQLHIDQNGGESPEPRWQLFPNGLDPAPLAAAPICGKNHIVFARPSEKRPRSPQELHIAPVEAKQPKEGEVLVRSRAFNDVSIAPIKGGAILVWTADKRSWGMVLSCPKN